MMRSTASVRLAVAALAFVVSLPAPEAQAKDNKRIEKLLASADGRTQQSAYKVRSVAEEYEILGALGLEPGSQSLIMGDGGKAFNMIEATDAAKGETREVWFNISSFFGRSIGGF